MKERFVKKDFSRHMRNRCSYPIAITMLLAGCASGQSNYDPQARETLGRISDRKVVGSFARTVEPLGGPEAAMAVGGYVGWIVARGLFATQSSVTLFEYTVNLEDGTSRKVASEWGSHAPGDCVRVFETQTNRKDYPRLASASGCVR